MSGEFEKDWKILTSKVAELYWFLDFYKEVFKPDNERVINEFPLFFNIIRTLIIEHLILGISRLLDPFQHKSRGNKNLTLETFIEIYPDRIRNNRDKNYCKCRLECIRHKAEPLRKVRNKRIAHFDYKKGPGIYEEVQITLEDIKRILREIEEFINLFESGKGETNFSQVSFESVEELDYMLGFILANKKILDELYLLRGVLPKEDKEDMLNSIAEILRRRSEKLPEHISHLKEFLLGESWEF